MAAQRTMIGDGPASDGGWRAAVRGRHGARGARRSAKARCGRRRSVGARRTATRDARAPCGQRGGACREHRPTHGGMRSGPHEGRNADTTAGEGVLAKAICVAVGLAAGRGRRYADAGRRSAALGPNGEGDCRKTVNCWCGGPERRRLAVHFRRLAVHGEG